MESDNTNFILNLHRIINAEKYNSSLKLFRVTAYVISFVRNLKAKCSKNKSGCTIVKLKKEQGHVDKIRMNELKLSLGIYHDENGLMRLKGCMQNANLDFSSKHPIYLDNDSYVTHLLTVDFHEKVVHSDVRDTLKDLHAEYWVPQRRRTVNKVILKYYICKRYGQSKPYERPYNGTVTSFSCESRF